MANPTKQVLLCLALLGGAAAISTVLFLNRPPSPLQPPEYAPVKVEAALVEQETVRIPVQAQGTVSPLRQTAMISEVRGRVVEVSEHFLAGGFVAKDEVLLRIDPRDYQAALLRAQAAVESADSSLAQERGRAEVALQEWKKLPKNSQRSQEATDLYLRKPQLEQAESQALAARADLDYARDDLERTIIRAPYDALILSKNTDIGQFVSPGTMLTELFSVETAEVRLPLPQSRLDYLELPGLRDDSPGASIDLYTDVGGEVQHWPASLHRTEGVYDERSRALYVVARVEDPYGLQNPGRPPLRIGTFVNANIEGRAIDNLVVLPRRILRSGNQLWVIDADNKLRNRTVETLRAGNELVYVTSGLQAGELVSLNALDPSFAGAEVEILETTPTSELSETEEASPLMDESAISVDSTEATEASDSGTS